MLCCIRLEPDRHRATGFGCIRTSTSTPAYTWDPLHGCVCDASVARGFIARRETPPAVGGERVRRARMATAAYHAYT